MADERLVATVVAALHRGEHSAAGDVNCGYRSGCPALSRAELFAPAVVLVAGEVIAERLEAVTVTGPRSGQRVQGIGDAAAMVRRLTGALLGGSDG